MRISQALLVAVPSLLLGLLIGVSIPRGAKHALPALTAPPALSDVRIDHAGANPQPVPEAGPHVAKHPAEVPPPRTPEAPALTFEDVLFTEADVPPGYRVTERFPRTEDSPLGPHFSMLMEPGPIGVEVVHIKDPTYLMIIPSMFKKDSTDWDRRFWKVGDFHIVVWCPKGKRELGLQGYEALSAAVRAKYGNRAVEVEPPGH